MSTSTAADPASLVAAGQAALGKSDTVTAKQHFMDAQKVLENSNAVDTPVMIDVLKGLAECASDTWEAEKLMRKALSVTERLKGSQSVEVADLLTDVGLYARMRGDQMTAEMELERALELYKRALGNECEPVAKILVILGNAARARSEFEKAEELYNKALAVRQKLYGEQSLGAARVWNYLGLCAEGSFRPSKAETFYQKAHDILKVLPDGPTSVEFAAVLQNLGMCANARGDLNEAERLFTESARVRSMHERN